MEISKTNSQNNILNLNEHQKWMHYALNLAKKAASQNEVPIGAVIINNNEVIAEGHNLREKSFKTTAHAEIVSLENFNIKNKTWRLPRHSKLYVTVEPCIMCTSALLNARLDELYFGCRDTKNAGYYSMENLILEGKFDHQFKNVESEILKEDCAQLISHFFKQRRNH